MSDNKGLAGSDWLPENHLREIVYSLRTQLAERDAQLAALREALTPSENTKGEYHGEFSWQVEVTGQDGEPVITRIYVPWTIVKEIMAAITARAATRQPTQDKGGE